MERVAENQPHRRTVPQDGRAEADPGARRVNDVHGGANSEPQKDDAGDRTARAHGERGRVSTPRERPAREQQRERVSRRRAGDQPADRGPTALRRVAVGDEHEDRKSTRLNSSHRTISYAVFCLKKKKIKSALVNSY